jgi:hypothetical protein
MVMMIVMMLMMRERVREAEELSPGRVLHMQAHVL